MEMNFNFIAIFSAALASFVVGGAYAALFKKQLTTLNGSLDDEARAKLNPNSKALIGIFLANLFMAFGIAYFVSVIGTNGISSALMLTFWSFVAFVGPLTIGPVLWEKKSINWWIFNNAINVVCLFVMIIILALWK